MTNQSSTRRSIAVIGSGVAGLTAAHILQREADVTLYEAADRLGGHADTHSVLGADGGTRAIDTGFIVHNLRTYPYLTRLFRELGVATQESDMSMSISCGECGLEYAGGRGLSGILPSARAASNPRYLRMLTEIRKFHKAAKAVLAGEESTLTVREFLAREKFSAYFDSHFMTPLISAVWSTAPSAAGDYPAQYLFTFLDNHGMLAVTGAPTWRTVTGGSARYVEAVAKTIGAVRLSTPVSSLALVGDQVELRTLDGAAELFASVVVAVHPAQALSLLTDPTPAEREVLGAIAYTSNPTLLHTDTSLLPAAPRAQASWNYALPSCGALPTSVRVSYNMNRLQRLEAPQTYVVTLNGEELIEPSSVVARMDYEHPVYTTESVAARSRLSELSDDRIAFAGAYHGWGFHEDGCRSGVEAARALGVNW